MSDLLNLDSRQGWPSELLFLLQALARDADTAEGAAETYAEVSGTLLRRMLRHLDDEEDLVIPLMLTRGEAALEL